jgi:hypothetical protein
MAEPIREDRAMNVMQASHEWATRPADERFATLGELYAAVKARRDSSKTFKGAANRLQLATDAGRLVIRAGETTMVPSHFAFGQLATVAGAPGSYLRTLPPDLAVANLGYGLARAEGAFDDGNVKMLVRERPGQLPQLRAVTSTKYGRIWDAEVVEGVMRVVENNPQFHNPPGWGGKPSGLYASDRDVFCFLVDGGSVIEEPDGFGHRPAQMHRGFFVKNSETGNGVFELCCFYFRIVCGNHIIWDAEGVQGIRIRHNRLAPQHFVANALPQIRTYIAASDRGMREQIGKAMQITLPAPKEERVEWIQGRGFTKAEATDAIELAEKEEGDGRTLWQVIQGLTARARELVYVDARVDLEQRAGQLMKLAA